MTAHKWTTNEIKAFWKGWASAILGCAIATILIYTLNEMWKYYVL